MGKFKLHTIQNLFILSEIWGFFEKSPHFRSTKILAPDYLSTELIGEFHAQKGIN